MSKPRLDRVERRDRQSYNPMTLAELSKLTINWNTYFTKIGLAKVDTIVSQPKYMVALETMLKENKVDQWKAYMRWSLLNRASSQLSTDIENANFEFYGKP
jgi:predicted metalloendopeptidase